MNSAFYSYPLHVSTLFLGHLQVVYTLNVEHLNFHSIYHRVKW
jgi:hypothetical protein